MNEQQLIKLVRSNLSLFKKQFRNADGEILGEKALCRQTEDSELRSSKIMRYSIIEEENSRQSDGNVSGEGESDIYTVSHDPNSDYRHRTTLQPRESVNISYSKSNSRQKGHRRTTIWRENERKSQNSRDSSLKSDDKVFTQSKSQLQSPQRDRRLYGTLERANKKGNGTDRISRAKENELHSYKHNHNQNSFRTIDHSQKGQILQMKNLFSNDNSRFSQSRNSRNSRDSRKRNKIFSHYSCSQKRRNSIDRRTVNVNVNTSLLDADKEHLHSKQIVNDKIQKSQKQQSHLVQDSSSSATANFSKNKNLLIQIQEQIQMGVSLQLQEKLSVMKSKQQSHEEDKRQQIPLSSDIYTANHLPKAQQQCQRHSRTPINKLISSSIPLAHPVQVNSEESQETFMCNASILPSPRTLKQMMAHARKKNAKDRSGNRQNRMISEYAPQETLLSGNQRTVVDMSRKRQYSSQCSKVIVHPPIPALNVNGRNFLENVNFFYHNQVQ